MFVHGWFQTVLIPPKPLEEVDEVDEYFDTYLDTESDYDAGLVRMTFNFVQ